MAFWTERKARAGERVVAPGVVRRHCGFARRGLQIRRGGAVSDERVDGFGRLPRAKDWNQQICVIVRAMGPGKWERRETGLLGLPALQT